MGAYLNDCFPANICLFKVNNRNTRKRCEICSKLTIKTLLKSVSLTRLSNVFIDEFEQVNHFWVLNITKLITIQQSHCVYNVYKSSDVATAEYFWFWGSCFWTGFCGFTSVIGPTAITYSSFFIRTNFIKTARLKVVRKYEQNFKKHFKAWKFQIKNKITMIYISFKIN